MIFDANQHLINYQINEIRGKINKIYIKNTKKAEALNDKLKELEDKALIESEIDTDTNGLILNDSSKDIKIELNKLEEEIDNTLNETNINEVSLDRVDELLSLKELAQAYKSTKPNLLQLNKFNDDLVKKLLRLLDRKLITINDIKCFYDDFNIQLVKNAMFEYKSKKLNEQELMIFSNQLDKFNTTSSLDKLFELFLGINYPYEETVSDIEYPTAYKKSTTKLIGELAEIVYGENLKKTDVLKALYHIYRVHGGMLGDMYTIFTNSYGIVSLEERKIGELEEKNPLFDDAIGCVCTGRYFNHPRMNNLKFLYILNKETKVGYSLFDDDVQSPEYIYITNIDNPFTVRDVKAPYLKEVCYEKSTSSFSADKMRSCIYGDYKIVAEVSNKLLKKILK